MADARQLFQKRRNRVRRSLKKTANGKPRLSVFRSGKNIYAQVIDDLTGKTVAAASTIDQTVKDQVKSGSNKEAAAGVGKLIAERATQAGITDVIFDRGGYLYHGRVQSLAEAAREAGLKF